MEPNSERNVPDPLSPQLREAERTLEQALEEACDARPVTKADTGELIKIEEMLAIASDAAKRAISIRRRRRQRPRRSATAGADAPPPGGEGETPPEGSSVLPRLPDDVVGGDPFGHHRIFTDEDGETWDVWAVYPQSRGSPHSVLRGSYRNGWLCLESGRQKRRLSPIPPNWHTMTDVELKALRDRADVVPPRSS